MQEIKKAKMRKNNIKLFPIYQTIGLDFMFFYAIQLLFLTQIKGMESSSAVLLSSFYAFFSILFTLPITKLVLEIGKKNAIVLGNTLCLAYIVMWIFCNSYAGFVIAEAIAAFGMGLKSVTEGAFIYSSVPQFNKKKELVTKINSKGASASSYFSAFSLLISGMLYDINPYLPLVCCAMCFGISVIISVNFLDVDHIEKDKDEENIRKTSNREFKAHLKFINKSQRLRGLIIMMAFIWGVVTLVIPYRTALLEDMGCTATFIGMLAAVLELIKGFASKEANKFNKKHKNKSLTIIALSITLAMVMAGIAVVLNISSSSQLVIVVLAFIVASVGKGLYQVLQSKYLNNFADNKIITEIYSVNYILMNISKMIIVCIGAAVLARVETRYAIIIVGILLTCVALCISKYMSTRVGLKPEEYKKKDIKYG